MFQLVENLAKMATFKFRWGDARWLSAGNIYAKLIAKVITVTTLNKISVEWVGLSLATQQITADCRYHWLWQPSVPPVTTNDLIHKSHNAPVPYPTMHHSEQKCAHFCSEWCFVGYETCTLCDLWIVVSWRLSAFADCVECLGQRGLHKTVGYNCPSKLNFMTARLIRVKAWLSDCIP